MRATRSIAAFVASLALETCAGRRESNARETTLAPPLPGVVVARIGDEIVTAEELRDFAREEHIADARQALDRYLERRLLARHAIARGAATDPLVLDVARRAAVQALLARAVEARSTEANVPPQALEFARKTRGFALSHGPLQRVWHALVQRERDASRASSPEARRARAEAIRAALVAEPAPLTFERLRAVAERVPGAGTLHVEPVVGFDARGETGRPDAVHPAFAAAAAAIEQPGGVSPVVETPFGLHVIVLERREPGVSTDPAIVEREVLREAVSAARARALQSLLADLRARYRVQLTAQTEGTP